MKIYKVRLDVNHYQSFLPEEEGIWKSKILQMDCTPKADRWQPPKIYVVNPARPRGNFFRLCSGAFVADSEATEKLRDLLEMAGELLPLEHKGENVSLLNVTECMNALDEERTEWELGKTTGAKIRILRYAFKPNRLPESSIFKIPETAKGEVLAIEGRSDPEDEFKFRVERGNLKGLLFDELWSDGQ